MNNVGAFWIALSIAFAGYSIGDAIRSLKTLKVEQNTIVRFADEAPDHGAP